jgi:hypothetical protein
MGPPIKNDTHLRTIIISNITIKHYFAKMYKLNGKSINFRDLWHFIQTIPLNVRVIKVDNKILRVCNGYINIHIPQEILDILLHNVYKLGSQSGDDKIIRTIYQTFLEQNV